jgi:DNA polymerase (family 10)
MREDTGEVELAGRGKLPGVVEASDVRGDLQVHTSWTDGSASIEAMARAAQRLGREYLAITDHTRDLAMTGGLDEDGLRAQQEAIRKARRKVPGIRILTGAEVNVRQDGSLDVNDAVLADLDVVGAAIHSHFDLPRAQMTRRIVRAIENPHVDLLFHPLARALGRRRPVDVDFDQVLDACLRTGTVLEIDAQPERLDLPDPLVRKAIEAGALVAISSDAHTVDELRYLETFGIGVARRGWVEPRHAINTRPVDEMLGLLKDHRKAPAGRRRKTAARAKKRKSKPSPARAHR